MKLFKVNINMPVKFATYYVAADTFDEAHDLAQEADQADGGHNGGVDQIMIVGSFGGDDDENLLLNDAASQRVASWVR